MGIFVGWVAHDGCEVADDEHYLVAHVLELAQLEEWDCAPYMQARSRRVDTELDAQLAPRPQHLLELVPWHYFSYGSRHYLVDGVITHVDTLPALGFLGMHSSAHGGFLSYLCNDLLHLSLRQCLYLFPLLA